MNANRLPQTDSIEELANFWDTHDLTEFEDELEEVTSPFLGSQTQGVVSITLPLEEMEAVRMAARTRGVDQADLIREWVLEKLHTP